MKSQVVILQARERGIFLGREGPPVFNDWDIWNDGVRLLIRMRGGVCCSARIWGSIGLGNPSLSTLFDNFRLSSSLMLASTELPTSRPQNSDNQFTIALVFPTPRSPTRRRILACCNLLPTAAPGFVSGDKQSKVLLRAGNETSNEKRSLLVSASASFVSVVSLGTGGAESNEWRSLAIDPAGECDLPMEIQIGVTC